MENAGKKTSYNITYSKVEMIFDYEHLRFLLVEGYWVLHFKSEKVIHSEINF